MIEIVLLYLQFLPYLIKFLLTGSWVSNLIEKFVGVETVSKSISRVTFRTSHGSVYFIGNHSLLPDVILCLLK